VASPSTKTNVLEGSVAGHILRMLGPFSIAVIALISTGIVDTIYLGRLEDPDRPRLAIMALAALGFAFPISFFGTSVNIGLGAGTMSAVSRALGQGDTEKARRHGASAMIIMPGLVLVSVASMSNNILRAGGEALLPSSIMILGALINIVLDPFLIYGWGPFPRMELQGAALATVIGNTIGAAYGFYLVLFHRKAVDFIGMTYTSIRRAWKIVGQVGLPAAGTNVIVPIATYCAVAIIGNTRLTGAFVGVAAANIVSGLIAIGWTLQKAPMTAKES